MTGVQTCALPIYSMRERKFMGNSSTRKVKVKLRKEDASDVLEFCLSPNQTINLNQDNQEAIKSMFCTLISILKDTDVVLELETEKNFDSDLMKEVAADYIRDLNIEIDNVRTKILKEYSTDN